MEFRVLGPLEIRRDGVVLEVRGSKRRAVLAVLVLHANEVVRTDRLIDDLWGEAPPANALASLRNHVSRLRKELGADVLVTKPWGYVLRADPDAIDLCRFERLLAESKPLPVQERAAILSEALALWRGPALADIADEPALAADVLRLNELRLAATEQRIDADLELGRHEDVVPELETLIAEQPLRERLRGQLILALYRSGRQAEALETYRETRRVLVEELGIEPGPELRELERAILRQDPALATAPPPPPPDGDQPPTRWRWPRSPLAVAAALLLLALAGAGLAAAIVTTSHDGAPSPEAAGAARPNTATTATTATTRPAHPSTASTTTKHVVVVTPTTGRPPPQKPPTTAEITPPPSKPTTAARPANSTGHTTPRPADGSTTPARPARQGPYVLADDFTNPVFDSRMWQRATDGSGWAFDERNGRLEISLAAESVPGAAGGAVKGQYGTQCRLIGDFDARVDFQLLDWPEANGSSAYIGAYTGRRGAATPAMERVSLPGLEGYLGYFSDSYGSVLADDTTGSLHLHRLNGQLIESVRHGGQWQRFASGQVTGGVTIVLLLAAQSDDFAHKDVRVAYDNFTAEADNVACPPGTPLPPRKRRA